MITPNGVTNKPFTEGLYLFTKMQRTRFNKRRKITKHTKSSGIYIIKTTINENIYVGSAVSLSNRKRTHLHNFNKGNHHNPYLQRLVNKYGIDVLQFSIIEFCPKEKLIEREQYWIDLLHPKFNICKIAGNCLGRTVSIETREKIRTKLIGRPGIKGIFHTKEAKEKISKAGIGKKHCLGHITPEITKQKIREGNVKYWNTIEGKKRARDRQLNFWVSEAGIKRKEIMRQNGREPKTEEVKRKISETLKKYHFNGHTKII